MLTVPAGVAPSGNLDLLRAFSRHVAAEFDRLDVLLTPALGERPLEIGALDCHGGSRQSFEAPARFTPFTAPWNVTRQPAISVPPFEGPDGMPLGVQVVGPPADEPTLLALTSQLEAARPWTQRRPGAPSVSADADYC
jgi:amidase